MTVQLIEAIVKPYNLDTLLIVITFTG